MRIKQKYMIDFAKGVTWLLVLYLIYYYNQADNLTAWVYFCLHGSYGIMWVSKSYIFPDKTWESKVGIPYALLILIGLVLYWAPAFIITSSAHQASLEIIVLAICTFSIGVFYHFASDMQKFIFLKYQSGLITDGFWKQCRHPNYFGEITLWIGMAVLSLSSLSGIEYVTAIVSPVFVYLLLRKAEGVPMLERISEERYGDLPEYQQYKENTPVLMMKIFK